VSTPWAGLTTDPVTLILTDPSDVGADVPPFALTPLPDPDFPEVCMECGRAATQARTPPHGADGSGWYDYEAVCDAHPVAPGDVAVTVPLAVARRAADLSAEVTD
jgi:hypothetical protein